MMIEEFMLPDINPDDYIVVDRKSNKKINMSDFIEAVELFQKYNDASHEALVIFRRLLNEEA